MKSGANKMDQNDIKRLAAQGMKPAEISKALGINPKTCEAFSRGVKEGDKIKPPAGTRAVKGEIPGAK